MKNKVIEEIKSIIKNKTYIYLDKYDVINTDQPLESWRETFIHSIKWMDISCGPSDYVFCSNFLSEDFIREFKNCVVWRNILRCQKLSENFIREFILEYKDEFYDCWFFIYFYQKISTSFILEFEDKFFPYIKE